MSRIGNPSTHRTANRRAAIDPAAVMRIKDIMLRARVIVEGHFNGLHRSPFYGFSSEFSEYRQYSPGDDTRYIDWRLYARTDRHYVKRFEDETNRRCLLVIDQSRSMSFGSLPYSKAEYTRTLAATFAYYLTLQRDRVGLLTYDEEVQDYLPPRHRPGHLRHLMAHLERAEQGTGTAIAGALEQVASIARKRGLVVLISDFLAPVDQLQLPLAYLAARGHEIWALRILDPAEFKFDFTQTSTFFDLESGREVVIDPKSARRHYHDRFHAHRQQLVDACATLGVELTEIFTDQPWEYALMEWLVQQNRFFGRGRRSNVVAGRNN